MKRMIIAMALIALTFASASAQDVLNEIVKTSFATVNDTTQNIEVRKTAVFKYDAMTYLRSKLLQPADLLDKNVDLKKVNATIQVLNEQALAMNQYVDLYQKRLYEAKKKNRDIVTNLFKYIIYRLIFNFILWIPLTINIHYFSFVFYLFTSI